VFLAIGFVGGGTHRCSDGFLSPPSPSLRPVHVRTGLEQLPSPSQTTPSSISFSKTKTQGPRPCSYRRNHSPDHVTERRISLWCGRPCTAVGQHFTRMDMKCIIGIARDQKLPNWSGLRSSLWRVFLVRRRLWLSTASSGINYSIFQSRACSMAWCLGQYKRAAVQ